eukprot:snap_masked-scaffold_27-processed-gene-4.36-mRNA-1 protein AED:1.00 eAED:1.00 QI:0/0/0/0/1/1/2/0/85
MDDEEGITLLMKDWTHPYNYSIEYSKAFQAKIRSTIEISKLARFKAEDFSALHFDKLDDDFDPKKVTPILLSRIQCTRKTSKKLV